ncbi:MAG TPA: hypothetical protein VE622_01835, partial [Nitrososphaeraceae archaeon]|nr:hypothetical protein [Nitrososphaeraceae archaeon]
MEFSISVLLFAFGLIVSSPFVTSSAYAYSAKQQQQQQPSDRTNDGIPFLFPMPSISLDDNITISTKTTPSSQHDKNKPLDTYRLLETKPNQIQFKTILNSTADKNLLIDNSDNTTSLMGHNRVTTPQTLTVQGNKTTITAEKGQAATTAPAPTVTVQGNKTTITSAAAPTTAGGGGGGGNKTYSLNIGGKTYPIKYQITGNGNKLNNIIPQKDNATLLANIVSTSDGILTIELPRNIIDSKKQGGTDDDYAASADGQDTTANEIKNTNQVRTLAIDFDKGTNQIEVTGDHIV